MDISLLYFGDIVGKPGREALAEALPELKEKYDPDLILANGENATHGQGITTDRYEALRAIGIDALTSGDHVWRFSEILPLLDSPDCTLLRPANYPGVPGKGWRDLEVKGKRLRLISLIGRVFMNGNVDSPFATFDAIAATLPKPDLTVVDFHAEATSEKRCFAEYVSGRAQLVVGTHTHVPTADAQILHGKTAFISDLGMCGPHDSSLGADKKEVIRSFLTGLPWRYSVGAGQCELGAIFCRINVQEQMATEIEHIRLFR